MLRNAKDRRMFAACTRYASLNKTERKIFEYLYSIKQFNGSVSDLARQLKYGTTRTLIKDSISNLEKRGFITTQKHVIGNKHSFEKIDSCAVNKNWWEEPEKTSEKIPQ